MRPHIKFVFQLPVVKEIEQAEVCLFSMKINGFGRYLTRNPRNLVDFCVKKNIKNLTFFDKFFKYECLTKMIIRSVPVATTAYQSLCRLTAQCIGSSSDWKSSSRPWFKASLSVSIAFSMDNEGFSGFS